MLRTLIAAAFLFVATVLAAQPVTFPTNGVATPKPIYTAFTNANIFTDYQTLVSNATLLLKDDKIEAVGTNVALPKGTVVYDLHGKYIYPAFIDLYSNYGMPEVKRADSGGPNNFVTPEKAPLNWNMAVKPEHNAVDIFGVSPKAADELRKIGFGAVLTQQNDGIMRGTSALVTLADSRSNEVVVKDKAATGYSFSKGSSIQDYPSSQMGSIALLRQTFLDADWYAKGGSKEELNLSLEAINKNKALPAIFEVGDKWSALRADKVGDEFGIQFIIKGSGDEYQRIDDLKASGAALIIPVGYPEPFDITDPDAISLVGITELKHWELAPANALFIDKAGIPFTFTSAGLKDPSMFLRSVRKALENGLPYKSALKALTQTPAQLVGASNLGDLKAGKLANFIITQDSLFTRSNGIAETWVSGKRYMQDDVTLPAIKGTYNATLKTPGSIDINFQLVIKGQPNRPSAEIHRDSTKFDIELSRDVNLLNISASLKKLGADKRVNANLYITQQANGHATNLGGRGFLSTGEAIELAAVFINDTLKTNRDTLKVKQPEGVVWYPFAPYGTAEKGKQGSFHIKNATVWTNEKDGKLENTDVVLSNGKITAVGKNLATPAGATVVDGTGKHVTAGIIDEHSHIAISKGVNEGGQSVTSEVRIGDVVNPDDVNIYRQLSGGVTAAQLLHGSANCIGGQAAIVKLRWGAGAEQMKIAGAPGSIKFALGENVKQSNWGESFTVRYPQTRMGVEQTFKDAFIRAKEYKSNWALYNGSKAKGLAPRKDLELDALVEILDNKRFITCHSYVQSEINMLMKLGDTLGFKVNTFTHILEGYKVADKMQKRGINASTFADWWAYKFEVQEAIPYNAAILNKVGVNTAINSDDAEMARRLNQEAGKIVKYGNVSEEDALKMVTLNPAKMLHIENTCGSIKTGKDADVVVWSGHPLSIYSKAEKTFVDGMLLFDRDADVALRKTLNAERVRLLAKMGDAAKRGEKTRKPEGKPMLFYHCNTIGEEGDSKENMH